MKTSISGRLKKPRTDTGGKPKGRARATEQGGDRVRKTKTHLKIEDELETTNADRNGNDSETTNSVRTFDSEMPNQLKAK